jgi:hypothetical protein
MVCFRDNRIYRGIPEKKVIVDVAVISGSLAPKPEMLKSMVQMNQVVLDASVKNYQATIWQDWCRESNIPCHPVAVKGAFVWMTGGSSP